MTINNIIDDKCISLNLRTNLLNSTGKKNSNLLSPKDNGNKINFYGKAKIILK